MRGYSEDTNLGKYLGFLLNNLGNFKGRAFSFLIKKIRSQLTEWKVELLSTAESLVKVEKIYHDLFWGFESEKRKYHGVV